jgi:hypothetical protein
MPAQKAAYKEDKVHRRLHRERAAEADGHGPRAGARLRHGAEDPRDGGGRGYSKPSTGCAKRIVDVINRRVIRS